jgi:hypothetical protein
MESPRGITFTPPLLSARAASTFVTAPNAVSATARAAVKNHRRWVRVLRTRSRM